MRANARRVVLVASAALALDSCASSRPGAPPPSCEECITSLFPVAGPMGLTLVGKARIDLPRYRVRGVIRILYAPQGNLRIDFRHSSLFGVYREDATILLAADTLSIIDRERGRLFGSDSSIALIGEALGIGIQPDDLLYALLLAAAPCPELSSPRVKRDGPQLSLTAGWRGREILLRGKAGVGPSDLTQCINGKRHCYKITYGNFRNCGGFRYPGRIRISEEKEGGVLSLEFSRMECGAVDPAEITAIGLVSP